MLSIFMVIGNGHFQTDFLINHLKAFKEFLSEPLLFLILTLILVFLIKYRLSVYLICINLYRHQP